MGRHGHAEGEQGEYGNAPGNQGQAHGLADATNMNADDCGKHGELDRPTANAEHRFGVGRDKGRRSTGADDQRQGAGSADQVADEGPEGSLCIREYTTGTGQGGRQFGHAQGQTAA
ncbi:hypothetical protein D3C80_1736770 [compost metagenome]